MLQALSAADLTQPIRVSPDGHFLVEGDGSPFFWLGDTAWTIFTRLTREETEAYLKDRAVKGFNIIQAVAVDGPMEDFNAPNRYNDRPFLDGDLRRPNDAYFRHVDWVIERARSYGIRVALLPTWALAHISLDRTKYDPINAEAYGHWLGSRYRGSGVVWVLGGDTMPIFAAPQPRRGDSKPGEPLFKVPVTVVDDRPIYDAMAKGIEEGFGADAFITFHPAHFNFSGVAEGRTSRFFFDRAYLDMNMLQSAHFKDPRDHMKSIGAEQSLIASLSYHYVREEYDSIPTRPIIDGEARFEDLAIDLKPDASRGIWSGYDTRVAAYQDVFAGAAGHTYGNHAIWQFYDADVSRKYQLPPEIDWKAGLKRPVSKHFQFLKALMLSRPYFIRIPDQSLVVGETGGGPAHIGATRGKDGSYVMIYLPQGQAVTVDLTKLSGLHAIGWWFDPRAGVATRIEGQFATNARATFSPPSQGAERDWVLVVDDEKKGFGVPGAAY